jgi:hydroxymethylpyrimidine pyrophosphatase-like HAD family hydrolase
VRASDRAALQALQRKGIAVSIVTGRLYSGSREIARSVGVHGPIACLDGSHIVRVSDDHPLATHALSQRDTEGLRELLAKDRPAVFVLALDTISYDTTGMPYLEYLKTWSQSVQHVPEVLCSAAWPPATTMAAVVVGVREEVDGLRQRISAAPELGLQAAAFALDPAGLRGRWGMVIRSVGANKGTAVQWMAQHYGVRPQEVVAVGDWLNDIPMLRAAGRSFAMGQAPREVLAAASDRLEADANWGGGVAEAAERAGIL